MESPFPHTANARDLCVLLGAGIALMRTCDTIHEAVRGRSEDQGPLECGRRFVASFRATSVRAYDDRA